MNSSKHGLEPRRKQKSIGISNKLLYCFQPEVVPMLPGEIGTRFVVSNDSMLPGLKPGTEVFAVPCLISSLDQSTDGVYAICVTDSLGTAWVNICGRIKPRLSVFGETLILYFDNSDYLARSFKLSRIVELYEVKGIVWQAL